jgi:TonB family protein
MPKDLAVLVGAIAVCAFELTHAQQPTGSDDREQKQLICGRVVSVSCTGADPPDISIAVDRVLVSVDVRSDDRHDARTRATGLLFRQVCAAGTLKEKGTAFKVPDFEVASIDDISTSPGEPPKDWVHPGVYRTCDAGVELPKVIKSGRPRYTVDAMAAGVQGAVWVEAVVEVNGSVGNTRVLRSLDTVRGLDVEAVNAVKRWRFIPGNKDGRPAPILVTIEVTFTLKDDRP